MEPFAIQQCWVQQCEHFDSKAELLGEGVDPDENVNEQMNNVKGDLIEKVKQEEQMMKHDKEATNAQQQRLTRWMVVPLWCSGIACTG